MPKATFLQKKLVIETAAINKAALVYRALYHPLRLKILNLIHGVQSMNVTRLVRKLKLEQSVISQQLRILREANVLIAERQGKQIFYSINYEQLDKIRIHSQNLSPIPSRNEKPIEKIISKHAARRRYTIQDVPVFTVKEKLVIQMICDQKANEEIADSLGLSKRTIEGYRDDIIKKMRVKNTAGLVVYAITAGIYRIKNSL